MALQPPGGSAKRKANRVAADPAPVIRNKRICRHTHTIMESAIKLIRNQLKQKDDQLQTLQEEREELKKLIKLMVALAAKPAAESAAKATAAALAVAEKQPAAVIAVVAAALAAKQSAKQPAAKQPAAAEVSTSAKKPSWADIADEEETSWCVTFNGPFTGKIYQAVKT